MTDNHTKHKNAGDAAGLQASPCTNPLHRTVLPWFRPAWQDRFTQQQKTRYHAHPVRHQYLSHTHILPPLALVHQHGSNSLHSQPQSVKSFYNELQSNTTLTAAHQHGCKTTCPTGSTLHRVGKQPLMRCSAHTLGLVRCTAEPEQPHQCTYRVDLFLSPKSGCLHIARMPC